MRCHHCARALIAPAGIKPIGWLVTTLGWVCPSCQRANRDVR